MELDIFAANFQDEFKKTYERRMRTPSNQQHRQQTIISMDKRQADMNFTMKRTRSNTRKYAGIVVPSDKNSHLRLSKPNFPHGVGRSSHENSSMGMGMISNEVKRLKNAQKKKYMQQLKEQQTRATSDAIQDTGNEQSEADREIDPILEMGERFPPPQVEIPPRMTSPIHSYEFEEPTPVRQRSSSPLSMYPNEELQWWWTGGASDPNQPGHKLQSNQELEAMASRLVSMNTMGSKPSQMKIECAREQRNAQNQPDKWFTRIVPAAIAIDGQPHVAKQLVSSPTGPLLTFQDTLKNPQYKLSNQLAQERIKELMQKRALKRQSEYFKDRNVLEDRLTTEQRRLQVEVQQFKASLRLDEPKPPVLPGVNADLNVVDNSQSLKDEESKKPEVDDEGKDEDSDKEGSKAKAKKKKKGAVGRIMKKGFKKKAAEKEAELARQKAAEEERKKREKEQRNKANLYPEPTSKIFGLESMKPARPKSAATSVGKRAQIKYNKAPPQMITPFGDSSAQFLRKVRDNASERDGLIKKLSNKSRQCAIVRQKAAHAMGGDVDHPTLLELKRLQERNMKSAFDRQESRWDKQITLINKKRGTSSASLLEQQYRDHLGRQSAQKLLINEMSLSQLIDKAANEEDEERKMHISVESLCDDKGEPSSPRPPGVGRLDLGKLNKDLQVGQGLIKKNHKSQLSIPGKERAASQGIALEAYKHDMTKQYAGRKDDGQLSSSRKAVFRAKSMNKEKGKELLGLNAIKKVNVPIYKEPPSIGGPDNLFDRFPIKKRKPPPVGADFKADQLSQRSDISDGRAVDVEFIKSLKHIKETVLYNIQDIRTCLEQLTEDEEEIARQSTDAKDIWDIKRDIRIYFKREKMAKASYMAFGYSATLFNYKIGRVLGRGAFGKVNLAYHKLTKKLCAVKSINKTFIKQMSAMMKLENEIFLLRYLRHPSIIKLFEAVDTSDKPPKGNSKTKSDLEKKSLNYHLFFMELCQGGDLLHYVRRRKQLEEPYAKYIMYELLLGVGYIHSRRICHRDIKLENILLDNLGMVKLCDFGISKLVGDDIIEEDGRSTMPVMTECCGTPVYMAPEVIKCDEKLMNEEKLQRADDKIGYGFEVDMWSCGVVLYALLYGNFPFKGVSVRDIKLEVIQGTLMLKKTISQQAQDLISKMLTRDPKKRITLQEIFKHSWLRNHDKPERIFNNTERELISSEFIYMHGETDFCKTGDHESSKAPTIFKPMKSELFDFRYGNLQSTQGSGAANITGKSDMLAPFNSSCDQHKEKDMEEYRQMLAEYRMYDVKEDALLFEPKAKVYDIKYERDYNQYQDNGVLLESEDGVPDKAPETEVGNKLLGTRGGPTQDSDKSSTIIKRSKKNENDGRIMVESFRPDWKSPRDVEMGLARRPEYDMFHPDFAIKPDIVLSLVQIGFPEAHVIESLSNNHANHCSATYYLYDKDQNTIS